MDHRPDVDTFAPTGPHLVTADELKDPHKLQIQLRPHGTTLQNSNSQRVHLRRAAPVVVPLGKLTLEPGDLIFTGTPPGVGIAAQAGRSCSKRATSLRSEIEGIGTLAQPGRRRIVSRLRLRRRSQNRGRTMLASTTCGERISRRWLLALPFVAAVAVLIRTSEPSRAVPQQSADPATEYTTNIKPLLNKYCLGCIRRSSRREARSGTVHERHGDSQGFEGLAADYRDA